MRLKTIKKGGIKDKKIQTNYHGSPSVSYDEEDIEYYYGDDVKFKVEFANDNTKADYTEQNSEDSKVLLIAPNDSISEIILLSVTSEADGDWYYLTEWQEELANFDSADMDNPIAIQMDWEDGNPTRALQYVDSEGSYHIGLIHYDSATGEFQISDSIATG